MPPRKLNVPDEETFYYVQIVDAELGRIRFGPFTIDQSVVSVANDLTTLIEEEGLVRTLELYEIWGGLRISLKGDDGTDILLTEIGPP